MKKVLVGLFLGVLLMVFASHNSCAETSGPPATWEGDSRRRACP